MPFKRSESGSRSDQLYRKSFDFRRIEKLIALLNISPIELVRTKETISKEQFKNQNLTDEQIIQAMVDFPKLIERPIVVNGNKAVIARPAEKIKDII